MFNQGEQTASDWLQWVIDIARAGDMPALVSAVDAADQWLHKDDAAGDDSDTAQRWAGAGVEEALREAKETGDYCTYQE